MWNKKVKLNKINKTLAVLIAAMSFNSFGSDTLKEPLVYSHNSKDLTWVNCPDFLPCQIASLNGELGGNNNDVFIKFPSLAEIPFHTHTSTEHMILLEGEFHTTYKGFERVVLKKGDYAFGPADLAHDGYCASKEDCVMFVAYETPIDAIPISNK